MNIIVDIRSLCSNPRTGVAEYTIGLLNALIVDRTPDEFFFWYNSSRDVSVPEWKQRNVHLMATQYPNKLLNASIVLFQRPYLDHLTMSTSRVKGRLSDVFIAPNLNFTSVSPNTKFVLTIHDLSFAFFPECFTKKQRLWHAAVRPRAQCERADLILTPSENTKRDVIDYFDVSESKVRVVRPGLPSESILSEEDTARIKKIYDLPEKFILYLGTLEPRKNIVGAIEAFEQSGLHKDGYEFLIAGPLGWLFDGILHAVQTHAGVRSIGFIPAREKRTLFSLARVFVYPSLYEGFGFPVLEAMRVGTPVVASNRSSLPEVVGDAGYLANPMNIADVAEGMRALALDEAYRELCIARGLKRAKEFVWKIDGLFEC